MNFPSPSASLLTISSSDCLETKQGQALDVQLTHVVVIVDDEYQLSGWPVREARTTHR